MIISHHKAKKIVQALTPPLAALGVIVASYIEQRYHIFWEGLMLASLLILWATHLRDPLQHPSRWWHIGVAIALGFINQTFAVSLVAHAAVSPRVLAHTPSFHMLLWFSYTIVFIAKIIRQVDQRGHDYLLCYSFWPKNPFLRLPSLISYYASSNGLFFMSCIVIVLFLKMQTSLYQQLTQLDLFLYVIFMIAMQSLLIWLSYAQLLRKIIMKRPIFYLVITWVTMMFLFFKLSQLKWTHYTIGYLQHSLASALAYLPRPNTLQLRMGMSFMLAPLTACLLFRLKINDILGLIGLCLGMLLASQMPISADLTYNGILGFFVVIALNLARAKSPLHAFDTPFLQTKRRPLNPYRWLIGLGYAPIALSVSLTILPPIYLFIIIQNFGLLIVLSCCYFACIQLMQAFYAWIKKSGFNNLNFLSKSSFDRSSDLTNIAI